MNIAADATRKLGPLPTYAWVILAVVAYYAYHKFYGTSSATTLNPASGTDSVSADATTAQDVANQVAADTGADPAAGYYYVDPSTGQGSYVGSALPPGTGTYTNGNLDVPTNQAWSAEVQSMLTGKGDDPIKVADAIAAYLAGKTLNASQAAYIDQALGTFGPAPSAPAPVVGTTTTPPKPPFHGNPIPAPHPTTKPPAPVVAPRTVTVTSGMTLSALAAKYYGNANAWSKIYDANRHVIGGNPSLIRPGERLVIPR